jgi:hypothetical protein
MGILCVLELAAFRQVPAARPALMTMFPVELFAFIGAGSVLLVAWATRLRSLTRHLERTTERLSVRTWSRAAANAYTRMELRFQAAICLVATGVTLALAADRLVAGSHMLDTVFLAVLSMLFLTGYVVWRKVQRIARAAP